MPHTVKWGEKKLIKTSAKSYLPESTNLTEQNVGFCVTVLFFIEKLFLSYQMYTKKKKQLILYHIFVTASTSN